MLSLASLLNPVSPEPSPSQLPSSPSLSLCTSASSHGSPHLPLRASIKRQKMIKDGAHFVKGKAKGEVNYPPFEQYDQSTLEKLQKFEVFPLRKIQEYPRHIPYNSEKKTFLEKTGRESFEVFQYTFKVPGDEKEYTVLWDYNIGLVRITPFFKSLGHTKTMPAKMLNQNPGLKEITHSITGGALAAQGYWMPFQCAFAVCTTFCAKIANALIPLFGPDFPAQCVDPDTPEHGRMIIDPSLVRMATEQAEAYRLQYNSLTPRSIPRGSYSPSQSSMSAQLPSTSTLRNATPDLGRRLRLKRAFGSESPYSNTPIDSDFENNSETSSGDGYLCSPSTPSSMTSQPWTQSMADLQTRNVTSHSANSSINISPQKPLLAPSPFLSAIPRSIGLLTETAQDVDMDGTNEWRTKRRAQDAIPEDEEYDGESSANDSAGSAASEKSDSVMSDDAGSSVGGAEKTAAWLLMKLSVGDGNVGADTAPALDDSCESGDGPRIKRRRATIL